MTPALLLLIVCAAILGLSAGVWDVRRRRRARAVRALATESHLNFSDQDRFHLGQRVAALLPSPGAADVQICNVIYGRDEASYRYIFTAHYTTGVILSRHRVRRVLRFVESQNRDDTAAAALTVADAGRNILTQYRELMKAA